MKQLCLHRIVPQTESPGVDMNYVVADEVEQRLHAAEVRHHLAALRIDKQEGRKSKQVQRPKGG